MSKRVVFCGTRGVPGSYGGFETAVDEISRRFVAAGYEVDVFCRHSSSTGDLPEHEGRKLLYVAGSPHRKLETFASAIQTGRLLLARRGHYDHIFWFNNANLPGIVMTLASGSAFSVNTDGLEWRRGKWSWPFKAYYVLASFLVARLARNAISDSRAIQQYYADRFLKRTHFIPYGAPPTTTLPPGEEAAVLTKYGVSPGKYFLQITRIEPDNLPLEAARAFIASGLGREGYHFIVIGLRDSTPYADALRALGGEPGLIAAPAEYDATTLLALRRNCLGYVHGNSVGGTNPALLEAMAACPRVLAIQGPFSQEVLGDLGLYFTVPGLADTMRAATTAPDVSLALQRRVHSHYDWDAVARAYMDLAEGQAPDYPALLSAVRP